MRAAVLIAVMAGVTALTRFLPFLIFRRNIPDYVLYLGRVLPPAIIGMLVIYCVREVQPSAAELFPVLAAGACVVLVQVRKRNSMASILAGTALYMLLLRLPL